MAEFYCALKYSARSPSNKSPTLISRKLDSQDCPSSSHPIGLGARRLFWPVVEESAIGLQGEKLSCSTLVHANNTTVNATKSFIYCEYWIGEASNLSCFASSTSRCFRAMWSYRQSYTRWLSASKETQQVAPWPEDMRQIAKCEKKTSVSFFIAGETKRLPPLGATLYWDRGASRVGLSGHEGVWKEYWMWNINVI